MGRSAGYSVRSVVVASAPGERLYEMAPAGDGLRAIVAPASGGEVSSLRWVQGRKDVELLYRANRFSSPKGWRGRTPLLWPAVGRSFTDEQIERARRTGKEPSMGRYRIGNREYDMPCHGFVMSRRWALEDIRVTGDGAEITCSVASADASRGVYPFDFRLLSTVSLSGPVLRWQVRVEASPGNTRPMPFSIGNHISLNFPFTRSGRWDKGILRGTATREYGITDISLLDGSSRPLDFRRGLRLADPALCNLVTGGFRAAPVLQLIQPGTLGVRVSQEFPSRPGLMPHRYFVLWGERGKRYFCPEPWLGGPNSLNTREGAVQLAPGGCFTWTMVVEVREDVSAVTPAR